MKDAIKVGDFVTVKEWINTKDYSYTGTCLEIKAVDGSLVRVFIHNGSLKGETITLDTKEVIFRKLSKAHTDNVLQKNLEDHIKKGLDWCKVPSHIHRSIINYLAYGAPTEEFLKAVISNNLKNAVALADDINVRNLPSFVRFLYNHAPSQSWGSPEKYDKWVGSGGMYYNNIRVL